jgi:hypothetical protein
MRRVFEFAAGAVLGVLIGAAGMCWLSTSVYSYGDTARSIAVATTTVAALEKLAAKQPDEARDILKITLHGEMLALRADPERLTAEQASLVKKLEMRAQPSSELTDMCNDAAAATFIKSCNRVLRIGACLVAAAVVAITVILWKSSEGSGGLIGGC